MLAVVIRLALLFGNIGEHPDFFFQDPALATTAMSEGDAPYMNTFGFEASNIACALVAGRGYTSPFGGSTGPTAWIAPGVVGLYAVAFALWGCFTVESILFAFLVAGAVSIVTTVVVYRIGCRVSGNPDVGFLAALYFACLPYEAWVFAIAGHLDFNLQVMWFAVLLLAVLRAMDASHPTSGLELGAVSAFAALFNPGLALCTAVGLVFVIRRRPRPDPVRFVSVVVLAHLLIVAPFVVLQSRRLGGFVPVKSNAGFELYLGNTPEARGVLTDEAFRAHHPSQNLVEFRRYRRVGEIEYVREARRRFLHEFRLADFLSTTLRRASQFFIGYHLKSYDASFVRVAVKSMFWAMPVLSFVALLILRRGRLDIRELATVTLVVAYSFPYLLTGVMERYRIPLVSVTALFLALVSWHLAERWRDGSPPQ